MTTEDTDPYEKKCLRFCCTGTAPVAWMLGGDGGGEGGDGGRGGGAALSVVGSQEDRQADRRRRGLGGGGGGGLGGGLVTAADSEDWTALAAEWATVRRRWFKCHL